MACSDRARIFFWISTFRSNSFSYFLAGRTYKKPHVFLGQWFMVVFKGSHQFSADYPLRCRELLVTHTSFVFVVISGHASPRTEQIDKLADWLTTLLDVNQWPCYQKMKGSRPASKCVICTVASRSF